MSVDHWRTSGRGIIGGAGIDRRLFLGLAVCGLLSGCSNFALETRTAPVALTPEIVTARINAVREAHGRKPWAYNDRLAAASKDQVDLMVAKNELSHNLGVTLRERVTKAGYDGAVGENVARGYATLEAAIEGWLASPGHRATLLSNRFVEFGLAYRTGKTGQIYWGMIAGGPYEAWYL